MRRRLDWRPSISLRPALATSKRRCGQMHGMRKFDRHLYCCTEADLAVRSESALRPPFSFVHYPLMRQTTVLLRTLTGKDKNYYYFLTFSRLSTLNCFSINRQKPCPRGLRVLAIHPQCVPHKVNMYILKSYDGKDCAPTAVSTKNTVTLLVDRVF